MSFRHRFQCVSVERGEANLTYAASSKLEVKSGQVLLIAIAFRQHDPNTSVTELDRGRA